MDTLDALPRPSGERVGVHLSADALRQVRNGHPWVWNRSITRTNRPGNTGDLAVIFDERRRFVAVGLWDPGQPIAVRILHAGPPRVIDADFFTDRLIAALDRRHALEADAATTGYRLVHGENDGLAGLVIDRYAATLVVRIDTAAWLPHLPMVVPLILSLTDAERAVFRAGRRVVADLPATLRDGHTIVGHAPDGPVPFLENGLLFEADVERGQKTGHFLDQRDNRRLVGSYCADADVLDVFCGTGGFSVYAAHGGARSVHGIDISSHAIAAADRHVSLNRLRAGYRARHTTDVADAFDALVGLGERKVRFDVVIVDPPSFAPNAAALPGARRAYRRLAMLAGRLVSPGGILFGASCSSRLDAADFYDLVDQGLADADRHAIKVVRTGHAVDHPVGFAQGAYLKALIAQVEAS